MFSLVTISLNLASGQQVPFTSIGIASMRGKDICDLQGQFPQHLGVYLDRRKDYAVEYKKRDGVIALFLLGKFRDGCGIVHAVLDLTPFIRTGETLEFKCYTDHEGGTTWGKWGHVVGLAGDEEGRFLKARLAWRVNIKEKRFEKIENKVVTCDTSGYAN